MKKKIIGGCIISLIVTIIAFAGPLLEMLQQKKAELTTYKTQLESKKVELAGVHATLNQQLIGKIDETQNKINSLLGIVQNAKKGIVNLIPLAEKFTAIDIKVLGISLKSDIELDFVKTKLAEAGLSVAVIGELMPALDAIINVLTTLDPTIKNIEGRFAPIVADLSPTEDPKGIYKGLNSAVVDMDKTITEMGKLEEFLSALGM